MSIVLRGRSIRGGRCYAALPSGVRGRSVGEGTGDGMGSPASVGRFGKAERMNLRELRAKAGLTQVELARRAGCSASYISAIEIGRGKPAASMTARILDGLDGVVVPAVQFSPPSIPFSSDKEKNVLHEIWLEGCYGTE